MKIREPVPAHPGGGPGPTARPGSRRPPRFLPATVAAALIALVSSLHAQDARSDWPEGSAVHTLHVESDRLQATRARLDRAHAALLHALGADTDDPSPLARLVAAEHAQWLAYRQADCELAGVLTGAGGAWPGVHGLTCQNEHLSRRLEVVANAGACLRALPAESSPYEQQECLQALVDWSMAEG